ncbi:alpha-amylase family protein [Cohnella luojiensis]|uniref:Beta-galactosidase n=1 Tax=Cohnella luojiensis TaxID=652876 RepID=A0A4Y8LW16_9BACL|nr:beta-galactosidase trimerization domain-containing protein [Cohnella luojiensis]TFE26088.1 beta-galactosidase [Cohnella luojiensis]
MNRFDPIRYRQVHLDFHTSEHIRDVGKDFSEEQFITSLRQARADTVNVFAMCHHGWSYFDTKVGKAHPHLATNLLSRMVSACKKNDIDAPIYITVGFNELAAREHPEWIVVSESGDLYGPPDASPDTPRPQGWSGWHMLCLNTPYLDYILAYTREVMERFQPVGIFYDIVGEYPCLCSFCKEQMSREGLDPSNEADRKQLAKRVYLNYLQRTSELIWSIEPSAKVYHNCCTERIGMNEMYPYYSHYDIESLPSGGWGYDYFTSFARYVRNLGMDYLGMTGKFHKSWGEFGGFKHPAALRFECSQIIAFGAKCCIGDQLHPNGIMDEETYRLIGEAYRDVEMKEQWCSNTEPVAEIAILSTVAVNRDGSFRDSDMGAYMMLEEAHYLFDIVDEKMDFSRYKLLIVPDYARISTELQAKLEMFSATGGKVIFSNESGLNDDRTSFVVDVGAVPEGKSPWDIDYTQVTNGLADDLIASPFLNYETGWRVRTNGAEVLAKAYRPYFNRTYATFNSHLHAPAAEEADYPSVIRHGKTIYISQPIFRMYRHHGMRLHRELFLRCVEQLLPERLVETSLPSCGKLNLVRSASRNDFVLHLLYANPIKRGDTQLIEDLPVIADVKVKVHRELNIQEALLVPGEQPLACEKDSEGTVTFVIPRLEAHQMVLLR